MKNLEENILCDLQILELWNENLFDLWTLELRNLFDSQLVQKKKKIPFDLQIKLCNEIWRNSFDL